MPRSLYVCIIDNEGHILRHREIPTGPDRLKQHLEPYIGNTNLKWAFSETAVLCLRGNDNAKRYLEKLQKRMSKAKALSVLAHRLGRCVFYMLKNETVFDEKRFLRR